MNEPIRLRLTAVVALIVGMCSPSINAGIFPPIAPVAPETDVTEALACGFGDTLNSPNYGLACSTCVGGARHGEFCLVSVNCDGGGICEPNDALCDSAFCGGPNTATNGGIHLPFPKNRFIGFQPFSGSTWEGKELAIRVKLLDIAGAPECTDQVRWAGPPADTCEGSVLQCGLTFNSSLLQATPIWMDWTTLTGAVEIYGEEIAPGSRYLIQVIDKSNEADLENEANYSLGLNVETAQWGDIIVPLGKLPRGKFSSATQPSLADVLAVVGKWLGGAPPIKVRSMLQPQVPTPIRPLSLSDVLRAVDAWLGSPYPFSVPSCTP